MAAHPDKKAPHPDRKAPHVTITSHDNTAPVTVSATAITLAGRAMDRPHGTIRAVTWSTEQGAQGDAQLSVGEGHDVWDWTADVPLVAGTNAITIHALDAASNTGMAGLTVIATPDVSGPGVSSGVPPSAQALP